MMFELSNLREFFYWLTGLGPVLFFFFIAKNFIIFFRKDGK